MRASVAGEQVAEHQHGRNDQNYYGGAARCD
jgi:hypothetical protein